MFLRKFQFVRRLLGWYDQHRRELPWRVPPGDKPDPYHILVSECMLQQTQVRTVIPYFRRFIHRWPTVQDLARAQEPEVLKAWEGLGYYSRARNLLSAARQIVAQHRGRIPATAESLIKLPGIGRYTAGALASIAFDVPAPILDGNVARVLCRLDRITSNRRIPRITRRLWDLAEELVPAKRAGDFNSAMMELGATICTPRSPQCPLCPVQRHCQAFAAGLQEQIPLPRKRSPVPLYGRRTLCLRRRDSGQTRWLIEQRPSRGRWAGLWQFVTVAMDGSPVTAAAVRAAAAVKSRRPRHIGTIEHALTHRRYRFDVYLCDVCGLLSASESNAPRRWVRLDDLRHYPLPRPHLRIAEMLREHAF
jgi:A/G-specific adenine glycosylase